MNSPRWVEYLLILLLMCAGKALFAQERLDDLRSQAVPADARKSVGNPSHSRKAEPGFVLIAPDRGFLGNREIKDVYEPFSREYRARLVFISLARDYEEAVRQKLKETIGDLREQGAEAIVMLPLLLSEADPHRQKAKALLESLAEPLPFAPSMAEDYLTAQILEDRARALSQTPAKERLVVIGSGAMSFEEAEAMRKDLVRVAESVTGRLGFRETTAVVLFHPAAPDDILHEGNRKAAEAIRAAASGSLRPVVIPFHLGSKHTASMHLGRRIESILKGLPAAYDGREVLPHPNALLWLKKTANPWVRPERDELGVVVMPHGAGEYVNEPILEAIAPLRQRYRLEVAFGMADVDALQEAVDKLESQGAKRILVLRLYNLSLTLKEETEYVLGLSSDSAALGHHAAHGGPGTPARVRTGALLSTAGGFDADPLIAEVLFQRVMEISREPEKETVILLAHGEGSEQRNRFWLEQMEAHAQYIRAKTANRFREVRVATLREDWPEKREKAIAELREMVAKASRDGGKALIVSNRLSGPGPARRYLHGLDYVLNDQGIAPHPNLTRWIEKEIEHWIAGLKGKS